MAAGEIIDRLCTSKGLITMRIGLLDNIIPARRNEVGDALNRARNFFKHASSKNPNETLHDFSDDVNLYAIIFAADGLRLLGADSPQVKTFGAWVSVIEPELMLASPPEEYVARIFGDVRNQSRSAPPPPETIRLGLLSH